VSFDAPGAGLGHGLDQGTYAFGINNLGVIAGYFQDSSNVFHGFVRYRDGSFTTFYAPGAGKNGGDYRGLSLWPSTRRARSRDTTRTPRMCFTALCATA